MGCCGSSAYGQSLDNEVEPLKAEEPTTADGSGKKSKLLFCGGCCCCLGILVILIALTFLAKVGGEAHVSKHREWAQNITLCETGDGEWIESSLAAQIAFGSEPVFHCSRGHGHLLTPANYTDYIRFDPCASPKLKEELKAFNAENEWELVHFPSRNGTHGQYQVTVAAWWLPVQNNQAPRIVVQHGNNANFNDRSVAVAAYLLRSMGFACLLPNFRDHGLSAASDHAAVTSWGWDYHLDLLGAWDYAVRDPEGKLGGPMSHDKVGLMGFSMGGFVTLNALGLEPTVPAAWVDSSVFDPYQALQSNMASQGLGFLTDLAWYFATRTAGGAGVDITLRTPANVFPLPNRSTRSLYLAHSQHDTTVPPSHSDNIERLIRDINEQANSTLYDLKGFYKADGMCGGYSHVNMHLWKPDVYRERLCEFWTGVFSMNTEECGLANLPLFDEADFPNEADDNSSRLLLA